MTTATARRSGAGRLIFWALLFVAALVAFAVAAGPGPKPGNPRPHTPRPPAGPVNPPPPKHVQK